MTHNQLQYMQNLETARHNMVDEAETLRSHRAGEKETKRSNKAREKETRRANKAKESLQKSEIDEKVRHNKISESQNAQSIMNQFAIGSAQAAAAHRQAAASEQNASTNAYNAEINMMNAETARNRQIVEGYSTGVHTAYDAFGTGAKLIDAIIPF